MKDHYAYYEAESTDALKYTAVQGATEKSPKFQKQA